MKKLVIVSGKVGVGKFMLTSALAIALHEIPQEIGDFAVLVYGGLEKNQF